MYISLDWGGVLKRRLIKIKRVSVRQLSSASYLFHHCSCDEAHGQLERKRLENLKQNINKIEKKKPIIIILYT
jgi:hypothetical protein